MSDKLSKTERDALFSAYSDEADVFIKWDAPKLLVGRILGISEDSEKGKFCSLLALSETAEEVSVKFTIPSSLQTQFEKLFVKENTLVKIKYTGETPSLKFKGKIAKSFVVWIFNAGQWVTTLETPFFNSNKNGGKNL